jgi:hypothetical protein
MVMVVPLPERRPDWHGEPVKLGENREAEHERNARSKQKYNRMLWGTHTS